MGTGMMGGGGFGGFGGFGLIGTILNLVVTVAVIIGIVWFVIWLVRRAGVNGLGALSLASAGQSPRDIVQARYARGEITREEYQELLADLS